MDTKKTKSHRVLQWYKKYAYLQRLIQDLVKRGDVGSSIMSFMLNTQLIEHRLKKEINLLNSFINKNISNSTFRLTTKSVEGIEEEKITLGNLIKELNLYDGELLNDLKKVLKELLHYRNLFIHKLFNMGTLEEAEKAALKGNQLAIRAWNEMESINYFTGGDYENDKFG